MGKAKTEEIRRLAIDHHKAGKKNREIFDIFRGSIHIKTIQNWVRQYKKTGKVSPSFSPGRSRSVSNHINVKKIKKLIKTHSQRQISRKLNISLGAVSKIIKELNLKVIL